MTKTILNKIGNIAKNSWKYVPIGWTIYDFIKEDLDLDNPWEDFKFGMKGVISASIILTLSLGIPKLISEKYNKDIKKNSREFKNTILSKTYYLNH